MKAVKYLTLLFLLWSCAGTHGIIQRYQFAVGRTELEDAVSSVLEEEGQITEDIIRNHYNDGKNYFTIFIKVGTDKYGYVLKYHGDDTLNETSGRSEIVIAFARINGKGGKEGDAELTEERKKRLLKVLEDELINPVSAILTTIKQNN